MAAEGYVEIELLYGCAVNVRLLPYLNLAIWVSDDWLRLLRGESSRFVPWAEIGSVRRFPVVQVLEVRSRQGERLFAVDYRIPYFGGLDAMLRDYVESERR